MRRVENGIETCDGDPVAAAGELYESDIKAIVNIIGFDVDQEAAQQLRAAAERGGGQYYEARDAAELQKIFKQDLDWIARAEYYNCQLFASYDDYNCVLDLANEEFNGIFNEVYLNKKYGACEGYILDQAGVRKDSILNAAGEQLDTNIESAGKEKDQEP